MILPVIGMVAMLTVPPTYVLERVATSGDRSERVSVFRDGTVVLVRRQGESSSRVQRQRLAMQELRVYLQLAAETYDDVRSFSSAGEGPGDAGIEIRVAPLDHDPVVVRMPLTAIPSVAVRRIIQALDDLAARLAELPGEQEDLSGWAPVPGDRLLLRDGRHVVVISVHPAVEGSIVEVDAADGAIRIFFEVEELRALVLRRVDP